MISALPGLRVGMHQRSGQARQRMQQVVLGIDRDLVSLDRAGTGIDDDLAFGAQLVPGAPLRIMTPCWGTSAAKCPARASSTSWSKACGVTDSKKR